MSTSVCLSLKLKHHSLNEWQGHLLSCPGQLKTWTTSNFKSGSGFSRKIVEHGQEWMDFSMGLSHIWGEIWQRGYSSPLWLVFCENLEVRWNHFPFLTDLLWYLEHNGWNSSSASFTQWLAPNPKGPLRSVWLWKNKDKTICGPIEMTGRLLQLNVNPTAVQAIEPPF